jgi:hypothetical protein
VSRRTKLIIAGVVVALGVILLVASVVGAQSPSSYVKDHYKRIGTDQGAEVYQSPKSATDTAKDIADAIKPADRLATPSGVFLRYSSDYVAVLAQPTGSHIEVSTERAGYSHFYGFVGGYWGTYSGPASSFRGGGPGAGK